MTDTPKRPRGRPNTGAGRRTIRLPAEMLVRWDAASTSDIRDALDRGLPLPPQ